MYPEGHARNISGNLERLLNTKFRQLAAHGVASVTNLEARLTNMLEKTPEEIRSLFDFEIIQK